MISLPWSEQIVATSENKRANKIQFCPCQCLLNEFITGFHEPGPLLINSAIDLKERTQWMPSKWRSYLNKDSALHQISHIMKNHLVIFSFHTLELICRCDLWMSDTFVTLLWQQKHFHSMKRRANQSHHLRELLLKWATDGVDGAFDRVRGYGLPAENQKHISDSLTCIY